MKAWQKVFVIVYGVVSLALLLSAATVEPRNRRSEVAQSYRLWTKINPKPVYVPPQAELSLASSTNADRTASLPGYVNVYVNRIGLQAMSSSNEAKFPVGAVVVKERCQAIVGQTGALQPPDDKAKPQMLTVMIKREPGFDQANGDWEIFACDANGKPLDSAGSPKQRDSSLDHTLRSYLTHFAPMNPVRYWQGFRGLMMKI